MKTPILIALSAGLVTAAVIRAAPALAEPAAVHVSIVRTADLDLATGVGKRRLDHRLAIAASEACGTASDADLIGKKNVRRCREDALARARAQIDRLIAAGRVNPTVAVAAAR